MLKRLPKITLPVKIALSCIILLVLFLQMDTEILKDEMQMVHASAWVYAIGLITAQFLFIALRWMLLINIGRHRMNYSESVQITLASLIANMLFITSISGIVVKITMALQYGASLFKSIFATAIDRLMTLAALILLCAVFLPSLSNYIDIPLARNITMFVGVMILCLFVLTPLITMAIIHKIPNMRLTKGHMRSGIRYLKLLFNNHARMGQILILSLLAQLCFFGAVYCVAISAGTQLNFLQIMIVLPAIALASSMPFSFGGWGVREGAFIYGLGLLAVPMEVAFSISVQIGLISLLGTIIAGLPTLLFTDILQYKSKTLKTVKVT